MRNYFFVTNLRIYFCVARNSGGTIFVYLGLFLHREYNKLHPSVDLAELARRTKNFSGAEIEGLVRAAQSSAMNRLVKAGGKVQVDDDAVDKLMITFEDFEYALEHDVKPVSVWDS